MAQESVFRLVLALFVVASSFAPTHAQQSRPSRYTVTDLSLPGEIGSSAFAINDHGDVVVQSVDQSGLVRSFVYTANGSRYPVTGLGTEQFLAVGINNNGDIVGNDTNGPHVVYRSGLRHALPLNYVMGINDQGQIVGSTYQMVPWSDFADRLQRAAVYSEALGVRFIGPPLWQSPDINGLTASSSIATAINGSGQVVGWKVPWPEAQGSRGWLGSVDGSFEDLGPAPWFPTNTRDVYPGGINSQGWGAGTTTSNPGSETVFAFVYRDGQFVNLAPNNPATWATGINDAGRVVGYQYSFSLDDYRATLFEGGLANDLNTLIPSNAGWNLTGAYAINNLGQIVGAGTYQGGQAQRAFLLTPAGVVCDFFISPTSEDFGASGGSAVVEVSTQQGCAWTAQSSVNWVKIDSFDGSGKGRVRYTVDPVNAAQARTGALSVAGQLFTLTQAASVTYYYYGLGDSVASGHGLPDEDGNGCHQSPNSYPRIVGRTLAPLGVKDQGAFLRTPFVQYLACSGANTTSQIDVSYPAKNLRFQVKAVKDDITALRLNGESAPAIVSITIGANDFPWSPPALLQLAQWELPGLLCASDATFRARIDQISKIVASNVRQHLIDLLAMPDISIILTDYHNPFNRDSNLLRLFASLKQDDCIRNGVSIPDGIYERTEQAVHQLNIQLSRLAGFGGRVRFASVHQAFHGHEGARASTGALGLGCGNDEPDFGASWIQYREILNLESYANNGDCFHPNERGAVEYARAVVSEANAVLNSKN